MNIIITSPSLDTNHNVSGVSAVTKFILENNLSNEYFHFILGKRDIDKRGFSSLFRILINWISWGTVMVFKPYALIHFNFSLDKLSIFRDSPLIIFTRLCHKRMVIHLHGGEFLENENAPRLIKILLRKVLSGKEPKIVLSTYEKEIIVKNYLARNVEVLPNCIDILEAKSFHRIYPYKSPLKLLFIGRIVKSKGLEYILQSLIALNKKGIHFKFILAGNGPEKDDYVQRFSSMLGSDFEFKGVVTGEAKTELFKQCNVFLLPSLYEGLPISLLESMSFGLVPIITNVGSIRYVISNGINGIFINKHSSNEIAFAIEKLSKDKEYLEKLSKNASQFIFGNFNPEVYIARLNEIYNYE